MDPQFDLRYLGMVFKTPATPRRARVLNTILCEFIGVAIAFERFALSCGHRCSSANTKSPAMPGSW
jgi:hypothetical protein